MAYIDKTYVNKEQYLIARNWWINNYKKMIDDLGYAQWFYSFNAFQSDNIDDEEVEITPELLKIHDDDINYYGDSDDFPLWNTSTLFDQWLIVNCDLPFVQERLIAQGYDENYWVKKHINDIRFGREENALLHIVNIDNQYKNDIYFFENKGDSTLMYDEMINFGTTNVYKLIHQFYKIFNATNIDEIESLESDFVIEYMYLGVLMRYIHSIKKVIINNIEYDPESIGFMLDYKEFNTFFNIPKIVHSYNLNDVKKKKWPLGSVILSNEKYSYNIDRYKKASKNLINRYSLELPEYIRENIVLYGK